MKKKMLAAAIASALAVPSAFAAIDDAGMKYTSASEGLYGSLRFSLQSGEDNDANVNHESSRIGMQGDVDVGHGNTAFYRAEWRVQYDESNSEPFQTRLAYIGMKGVYGSVRFGQIWSADYDYVTSLTDVTGNVTGNLAPRFRVKKRPPLRQPGHSRISTSRFSCMPITTTAKRRVLLNRAIHFLGTQKLPLWIRQPSSIPGKGAINPGTVTEYNNLDLTVDGSTGDQKRAAFLTQNGLEEVQNELEEVTGFRIAADDGVTDSDDGNEFDRYILAASYSIRGAKLAATYVNNQAPDGATFSAENDDSVPAGTRKEDETSWGIGGNYGQDNWKVGYLYWDTSDYRGVSGEDLTGHSFSGQVSFDKVTLRAVYDTQEFEPATGGSGDTDAFTLEAQYSFSSKARAYVNYQNVDREGNGAAFFGGAGRQDPEDSDTFYVAYRVDF